MIDFFRDPIWQFVGAVISFAALLVAVIAVRFQLLRKSLAWSNTINRDVFFLFDDRLKDRLKISLDGEPIRNLSTLDVTIFNDGNVAVTPTDFIAPLEITFPDEVRVFAHSVVESSPNHLPVEISRSGNTFVVSPLLLNSNDEFTLQFLVEAELLTSPKVLARISGVKNIWRRPFKNRLKHRLSYYAYKASSLLALLAILIIGFISNLAYVGFQYAMRNLGVGG